MHFAKSTVTFMLLSMAGFAAANPIHERGYCNPVAGGDSQCAAGETCVQEGEFPNIGVCTTPAVKRAICRPACTDGETCVQEGEFPNIGVCRASVAKRVGCEGGCPAGQSCVPLGEFPNIRHCA